MTEQNHTPGPWMRQEYHEVGIFNKSYVITNGNYRDIGDIPGLKVIARTPTGLGGEYEANARLIAAAPDLLEVLTALTATARTFRNVPKDEQDWGPIDDEALNAAFTAIAKAKGEL